MNVTVRTPRQIEVKYLHAKCGVRYWEDAKVNGKEDEDGTLIPCRVHDTWAPIIELDTGVIRAWPTGTTADIHYKVCDAGVYALLDADMNEIVSIEGYVPGMLAPKDSGYGDYVIMEVGPDGKIDGWEADLTPFENADD